jgi:hypothetical protein
MIRRVCLPPPPLLLAENVLRGLIKVGIVIGDVTRLRGLKPSGAAS